MYLFDLLYYSALRELLNVARDRIQSMVVLHKRHRCHRTTVEFDSVDPFAGLSTPRLHRPRALLSLSLDSIRSVSFSVCTTRVVRIYTALSDVLVYIFPLIVQFVCSGKSAVLLHSFGCYIYECNTGDALPATNVYSPFPCAAAAAAACGNDRTTWSCTCILHVLHRGSMLCASKRIYIYYMHSNCITHGQCAAYYVPEICYIYNADPGVPCFPALSSAANGCGRSGVRFYVVSCVGCRVAFWDFLQRNPLGDMIWYVMVCWYGMAWVHS